MGTTTKSLPLCSITQQPSLIHTSFLFDGMIMIKYSAGLENTFFFSLSPFLSLPPSFFLSPPPANLLFELKTHIQWNQTLPRLLKLSVNPLPLHVFLPSSFKNTSQTFLLASFSFSLEYISQVFLQGESVIVDHLLHETFLTWFSLKEVFAGHSRLKEYLEDVILVSSGFC